MQLVLANWIAVTPSLATTTTLSTRALLTSRIFDEGKVNPVKSFATHSQTNSQKGMEVIFYVLKDTLKHKDSIGTRSVIRPGDVQRISVGTGIMHIDYNHLDTALVSFWQIWNCSSSFINLLISNQLHFGSKSIRQISLTETIFAFL